MQVPLYIIVSKMLTVVMTLPVRSIIVKINLILLIQNKVVVVNKIMERVLQTVGIKTFRAMGCHFHKGVITILSILQVLILCRLQGKIAYIKPIHMGSLILKT